MLVLLSLCLNIFLFVCFWFSCLFMGVFYDGWILWYFHCFQNFCEICFYCVPVTDLFSYFKELYGFNAVGYVSIYADVTAYSTFCPFYYFADFNSVASVSFVTSFSVLMLLGCYGGSDFFVFSFSFLSLFPNLLLVSMYIYRWVILWLMLMMIVLILRCPQKALLLYLCTFFTSVFNPPFFPFITLLLHLHIFLNCLWHPINFTTSK